MRALPSIAAVLLGAVALLGACGGSDGGGDSGRVRVIATIAPVGALVQAVGGDFVELKVLAGAGIDPHEYEVSASDRKAIGRAAVIFWSGLGIDAFLVKAFDGARQPPMTLSAALKLRSGPDGASPDPHVWHDIENDKLMLAAIADALAASDPGHAEAYRANAAAYSAKLDETDRQIKTLLDAIPPQNRKVVTNHDSIGYFLARYGLTFVGAVIPGTSTQSEPSAKDIAELVSLIKKEGVKAIFSEGSVDPKVARQVAKDTGVTIVADLYGDSLGSKGSGAETIDGMLLSNAKKIAEALR